MFEHGLTVGEGFIWGMVFATVGWIALAFVSALILGAMIRRSDRDAEADDAAFLAQQLELREAARVAQEAVLAARDVVRAGHEAGRTEDENTPAQSGTRYKPVHDEAPAHDVEPGKVRSIRRGR